MVSATVFLNELQTQGNVLKVSVVGGSSRWRGGLYRSRESVVGVLDLDVWESVGCL